jgi:alpha-L-arabinofuranosidase
VRYWEIGNENWQNNTEKPADMAVIVARFADAMKTVDPSIKTGASGAKDQWWSQFLPAAAPHLDFISVSHYENWDWKSYDYLAAHPDFDLTGSAGTALRAIDQFAPPADRERLRVVVAELNSKDYAKDGWPDTNTLGHSLVTFESFGYLLREPRVSAAMLWNTRWVNDEETSDSLMYALDPFNQLTPSGRAVFLWGRYLRDRIVHTAGSTGTLSVYASASTDHRSLSIWIVNRSRDAAEGVNVDIAAPLAYGQVEVHRYSGAGPDDKNPIWSEVQEVAVEKNRIHRLSCPGVSATVIELTANGR